MNAEQTISFITALTGDANTVMDWRVIHDRTRVATNLRGTYYELSETLTSYNKQGYGIFCSINALNGQGFGLEHVEYIRTHVVDLDDVATARMNYDRAVSSYPQPHFAVQSSPGKFHLYWLTQPYQGNDFFTLHQRKIASWYGGDKSIIDSSRVLRVPGFYHLKHEPFLVQCWAIGQHDRFAAQEIEAAFQAVNIVDQTTERHPLGTEEMQAPSLEWLQFALSQLDPNNLTYEEWMSFTAAFKQSGWNLTDEETLYNMWNEWCCHYSGNNPSENRKLWDSHKQTQLGWKSIVYRVPQINAYMTLGHKQAPQGSLNPEGLNSLATISNNANTTVPDCQDFGEILSPEECRVWFDGCVFIEREGRVFTRQGRYLNNTQFNGKFGGKAFMYTSAGKTTDEPWKAALRSTQWTIPKVDHVRFLPDEGPMEIIEDRMGRRGVNTYIAPNIDSYEGDITLFHNHMALILPDEGDRKIWYDYMAHAIKYPGYKIQFAPLLQSAEGIGKSAFIEIMEHALGDMYVYTPNAQELVNSGSKFNAWMRSKLAIMVNEIKVDERRELIEILKPMITDNRIEIQAKGVDQEMEDNVANWFFFSNYRDAIPINKNGRRYAIFFSALQNAHDIMSAGMDKAYFDRFWDWLRNEGGKQMITHYFKNYAIECGEIAVRAPKTSSYDEALRLSRSPLEVIIADSIEDDMPGFRGGFVSAQAALNKAKNAGIRNATIRTVQNVLEQMGYHELGKTRSVVFQEDASARSIIYSTEPYADIVNYEQCQGYR